MCLCVGLSEACVCVFMYVCALTCKGSVWICVGTCVCADHERVSVPVPVEGVYGATMR